MCQRSFWCDPGERDRYTSASGKRWGGLAGVRADGELLANVAQWFDLSGSLARNGGAVGDDAQADDVCAEWRHRRGAHDLTARTAWWRAQLGLSLHLGARRFLLSWSIARDRV